MANRSVHGNERYEGRPCRYCGCTTKQWGNCTKCAVSRRRDRQLNNREQPKKIIADDQKTWAVLQVLEGRRKPAEVGQEIGVNRHSINDWIRESREEVIQQAASVVPTLTRQELKRWIGDIGLYDISGSLNRRKGNEKWFKRKGLRSLWAELVRQTPWVTAAQGSQEAVRFYCLQKNITKAPHCKAPGCNKPVVCHYFGRTGLGYADTCSHECAGRAKLGKPNLLLRKAVDYACIDSGGYRLVLDPNWKEGDPSHRRRRREHLIMLESIIHRRPDSKRESIHHMDGDKLNNQCTNFFVCTPTRHKTIEIRMGTLGKAMLMPGRPALPEYLRSGLKKILQPYKRLQGMFIQPEIYDRWRAEGKITNWSEGPRADWEISKAERQGIEATDEKQLGLLDSLAVGSGRVN